MTAVLPMSNIRSIPATKATPSAGKPTLSSAIASNLAKGYSIEMSVKRAKEYVSGALNSMLDLGKGQGPLNHAFSIKGNFTKEEF